MANYLVIGASSGIGKQISVDLENEGHQVYHTYFSKGAQEELKGPQISYDATQDELELDWLPEQLDGVVYCPGSIQLAPFHRLKPEAFMEDYQLQVLGAVRSLQRVYPLLKNSDQASVVLFSTIAVQKGFNFHSMVSSSKGAIEGLTRSLAAEWSPKIRVNSVAPSITQTPLAERLLNTEDKLRANAERHPLQRVGSVHDISEVSRFLLSSRSSWITGQCLHVDGGLSTINK